MGRPGRDHRGLPCEPGCCLCQDIALLAQLPVLTPQTGQLLALGAGRAVLSAAFVAISLTNPVPDRLGSRFELTRQLLRCSPRSHQINHLAPEFRGIGSVTLRHRWHLLLKWKGVHRTGATPRLCAQGSVAIDNRGLELLQAKPGESEDHAWARMRGRLGTGAHLHETLVTLPHNAPATHGSGATTPPAGTPGLPGLFPTGERPTSGPSGTDGGGFDEGAELTPVQPNGGQPTGDLFGVGGRARKTYQSEKPTSALN